MARKKSKSFGKHVYAVIAIIVLMVAAGILTSAFTITPPKPAGAASHNILYIGDRIASIVGSGGSFLVDSSMIVQGNISAIAGGSAVGVRGVGSTGNEGKLGTSSAGVEGSSSTKYGIKGASTAADANGIGVYGASSSINTLAGGVVGYNSLNANSGYLGSYSAAVKGAAQSGIGVYGATNDAANYAGKFEGGKGLYASKIEFGSGAFDQAAQGLLILGKSSITTTSCSTICTNHGLSCIAAYTTTGTASTCSATTGMLYCWCD